MDIKITLILTVTLLILYPYGDCAIINIAGLYSNDDGLWRAEVVRIYTDIAVEMINNNANILEAHKLNITWKLSQCNRRTALNNLIEFTLEKDKIYNFVFGPSCSTAAESVAELIPAYSLNMLSGTATSPGLTNPANYPNTFLGVPTSLNLVVAYLKLIEKYNWRRVGLISDEADIFNSVYEVLSDELKNKSIGFDTERIFNASNSDEVDRKLDRLFIGQKYKIIIGSFYEDNAFLVLCRAFENNYGYPQVTWILPSWFSREWLHNASPRCSYSEKKNKRHCCTPGDIKNIIQGALGVDVVTRLNSSGLDRSENTIFNMTRDELWKKIRTKHRVQNFDPNVEKYATYAFDSIITLAKIFEKVYINESKELSNFNYHNRSLKLLNDKFSEDLVKKFEEISFIGLTGEVSYRDRAREYSPAEVVEFIDGKEELRGVLPPISSVHIKNISTYTSQINMISEFKYFSKEASGFDGVELHILPDTALIFTILFAITVMAYTILFMLINLLFRKKKVFKLSSPFLNTLILSGCMLQCVVAILVVFDNRILGRTPEDQLRDSKCILCTLLCHLVWWLPALATDIIFGTLVGKAFRVYRIAIAQSFQSRFNTLHIILFICILMGLDTVYTAVWAAIPQLQLVFNAQGPFETANTDVRETGAPFWYIFYCTEGGDPNSKAIIVRFGYTVLRWILYGAGLYLAFQIRKINIRGVNEFHAISQATLTTVLFNIVRIILIMMIPSVRLIDTAISLLSISYSLDACLIVSYIFIPKLYYVIKDPNEKKVYGGIHNTSEIEIDSINQMIITNVREELKALRIERDNLKEEVLKHKLTFLIKPISFEQSDTQNPNEEKNPEDRQDDSEPSDTEQTQL